jgi:hypothetical protein
MLYNLIPDANANETMLQHDINTQRYAQDMPEMPTRSHRYRTLPQAAELYTCG